MSPTVNGGTATSERRRPSRSCVSVVTPKRTVTTYSFVWSLTYGINFVASPIRISRTPTAAGSRVPAWPTRSACRWRRTSATTSCDVTPATLSIAGCPRRAGSLDGGADGDEHGLSRGRERPRHREARGVPVTAAAERRGDGADVDLTLAAQADLHLAVPLTQETGDADGLDRARIVHEAPGLHECLGHEPGRQGQPGDPSVRAHLHPRKRRAQPAQRLARTALVERVGHAIGIGAS